MMPAAVGAVDLGISYRQLDYWTRQGHIHATGTPGSGYLRAWNDEELAVAALIGRLVGAELKLHRSAELARVLYRQQVFGVRPARAEAAPGVWIEVEP